jgi:hypothetical protein
VKHGHSTDNQSEDHLQTVAVLITLLTGGTQTVVTRLLAAAQLPHQAARTRSAPSTHLSDLPQGES